MNCWLKLYTHDSMCIVETQLLATVQNMKRIRVALMS